MQISLCPRLHRRHIETRDGKFYCHGERFTVFPLIPDSTEVIKCPSQSFKEFPTGAFLNKSGVLSIDVSNGSLETLSKDTFKGAGYLRSFNASKCNIRGKIPRETFCDHATNMMSVDLSNNPFYVFTSEPFECLPHLTHLRINNTIQPCHPRTVQWITSLGEGVVIGNECNISTPSIQSATTSSGTT